MPKSSVSDLPILRHLAAVLAHLIDQSNKLKTASSDLPELLAVSTVIDDLESQRDRVTRRISRLSRA